MKKLIHFSGILLLATALIFSSCASSKKGSCGCPNKQGMVGYK